MTFQAARQRVIDLLVTYTRNGISILNGDLIDALLGAAEARCRELISEHLGSQVPSEPEAEKEVHPVATEMPEKIRVWMSPSDDDLEICGWCLPNYATPRPDKSYRAFYVREDLLNAATEEIGRLRAEIAGLNEHLFRLGG